MEHIPVVHRLAGQRPDLIAHILQRHRVQGLRNAFMDAPLDRMRNLMGVPPHQSFWCGGVPVHPCDSCAGLAAMAITSLAV